MEQPECLLLHRSGEYCYLPVMTERLSEVFYDAFVTIRPFPGLRSFVLRSLMKPYKYNVASLDR